MEIASTDEPEPESVELLHLLTLQAQVLLDLLRDISEAAEMIEEEFPGIYVIPSTRVDFRGTEIPDFMPEGDLE